MVLQGRRILLIISGGIAAFKSLDLIRRLREQGALVRCVLTKGGAKFVTPLSVSALSEEKVYQDIFSLTDEAEMGHINLSREADLLVVAPASADILARMANGLASDLATTALLATNKPVMVAPAMNVRMWEHAATQANIDILRSRGVACIGPVEGVGRRVSDRAQVPVGDGVAVAAHVTVGGHGVGDVRGWRRPLARVRAEGHGVAPLDPHEVAFVDDPDAAEPVGLQRVGGHGGLGVGTAAVRDDHDVGGQLVDEERDVVGRAASAHRVRGGRDVR